MKKIIILISCLICALCSACSVARNYPVSLPREISSKAYTIWYTQDGTDIPFLAGLEQNLASHEIQLGLVFLQGKRFAKCTYNNKSLTCALEQGIPSFSMQQVADNSALMIAHILEPQNALPEHWEKTVQNNKIHNFRHINNDVSIRIEEN